MISSNPPSPSSPAPYAQRAPALPSAWSLEELHAPAGQLFQGAADGAQTPDALEQGADERERITAHAYQAGYEAGIAAARAGAQDEVASAMAALRCAAGELAASEARFLGALEENLAALAVCVARQLIAREVRSAPEIVVDLVRRAVAEFPIDQQLRIRINPIDLSVLASAPDGDAIRIAPGREISWAADARIYPGGCVVEGRDRIIDGRVDAALERAYRRLINSMA